MIGIKICLEKRNPSMIKEKTNNEFPQDVNKQLLGAICAVFLSWESNRAKIYRKLK